MTAHGRALRSLLLPCPIVNTELPSKMISIANLRTLACVACASVAVASQPLSAQRAGRPDWSARYQAIVTEKGQKADSVRLHELFALDWDYGNIEYPEGATYSGYKGQNDRWTDQSLAAIAQRKKELQGPLAVITSIDRASLAPNDQLNYDLFRRGAEDNIASTRFPGEYLSIDARSGPQLLSQAMELNPNTTVKDYEDIVSRVDGLGAVVDQTIVLLQKGLDAKITAPRITLRDVPDQVKGLLTADPMQSPVLVMFTRFPASIPAAEQKRLTAAAVKAYTEKVKPAYQRLYTFLTTKYIPGARETVGMSALPDGAAWYAYNVRIQTTTNRTPEQIHATGLAEVKRIRGQMDSVMKSIGYKGTFAEFTNFLRTDPKFFFTDSADLVRAYRDIVKRIDPELIKLFGHLPRLPYGVTTIPSYAAKSATTAYYQPGSYEAGRPGYYYVNTYALNTRPKWEMEALSSHEAVPGHHLQIAISQELTDLPNFRRYGGYTAFVEGWALYSESLGPSIGLYKDPYSKFGQLTYEMWRAIRLVIDTGIHAQGMSRQDAIDYFEANSAKTHNDIVVEVDRYITTPGQALAYKTGELKIKELRAYAEQQLGEKFDVREFHDQV
ncbi:MAG: DUF885 domain-containing protein, partial [Gemmatimonadota bacterium]|nr:DUF885 domain-containing protein [Gemmatimonadota bacterium]